MGHTAFCPPLLTEALLRGFFLDEPDTLSVLGLLLAGEVLVSPRRARFFTCLACPAVRCALGPQKYLHPGVSMA